MADKLPTSEEFFAAPSSLPTSDEFFSGQAKPATPSVGGFLSGMGSMLASTFGANPKFSGLGNAIEATKAAWQSLTPDQQESMKEYAPAAGITAASLMIPGGPAVQAAVNLGANSLIHGEEAYRKGGSVVSAMNPLNHPVESAIGAVAPYAVDLGLSFYRGLKGDSLVDRMVRPVEDAVTEAADGTSRAADAITAASDTSLPAMPGNELGPVLGAADDAADYAGIYKKPPSFMDAMRLDAPLPRLRDMPTLPVTAEVVDEVAPGAYPLLEGPTVEELQIPSNLPAIGTEDALPALADAAGAASDTTASGIRRYLQGIRDTASLAKEAAIGIRSGASLPARYLSKLDDEWAQVTGNYLDNLPLIKHRLGSMSEHMLNTTFKDLSAIEREEVTRLIDGSIPFDQASRPEVARAAAAQREYYKQWANVAKREGLPTLNKQTGEVYPFEERADFSPLIRKDTKRGLVERLRGIYPKDTLSHTRVSDTPAADEYLTDAYEIGKKYADSMAKKIAIARTFGAATGDRTLQQPVWGAQANKLYGMLQRGDDPVAAPMFKGAMDALYTGEKTSGHEALGFLNGLITASRLGGSWATQIGQAANPLWRWGFRNTAEGLGRYISDPTVRALTEASGVRDPGFANYLAGGNSETASAPVRAIGWMERKLRGPLNAGVIPYVEDLAARVDAGETSKALEKQLAELLLTPDSVRGGLTFNTLKDAIQAGGHRAQFHAGDVGQVGNWYLEPVPKALTALQPFGWKAWAAAQDDILEPLMSGDASLMKLGAGRLGKMVVGGALAETARNLPASLMRLREPDPREAAANLLGTQFGTVGQVIGGGLLGQAVDPRFNFQPPIMTVPLSLYTNTKDGRLDRVFLDGLSILDQTGYAAMARPTIAALLSHIQSDDRKKR